MMIAIIGMHAILRFFYQCYTTTNIVLSVIDSIYLAQYYIEKDT